MQHTKQIDLQTEVAHLTKNLGSIQKKWTWVAHKIKKRKYDPITATIHDMLHWLPSQQSIEYKLCDLVYKAMHHNAPVYLTKLCVPVSIHQGHANLRSAAHGDFSVAANKGTTYGRRSFTVSGPTTQNTLLLSTREQSLGLGQYRSHLKTKLFNRAYYVAKLSKQDFSRGARMEVPTISLALYKCTNLIA